jgi:hypothetical protein
MFLHLMAILRVNKLAVELMMTKVRTSVPSKVAAGSTFGLRGVVATSNVDIMSLLNPVYRFQYSK